MQVYLQFRRYHALENVENATGGRVKAKAKERLDLRRRPEARASRMRTKERKGKSTLGEWTGRKKESGPMGMVV